MRKLIALAGCATLVACSQAEAPAEPEAEEVAVVEEDTGPGGPGTYEVTNADGSISTMTTMEDGTYSGSTGDQAFSGTVENVDGKACFDAEGDEDGAMCWTASEPAEDGSWTATSDAGETVTVRPVEN